jgi:hypothetical protein
MNVHDNLSAEAGLYQQIWNYCIDECGKRSPVPCDASSIELFGVLLLIATKAGESTNVDRDNLRTDICSKHGINTRAYLASLKEFTSLVQQPN